MADTGDERVIIEVDVDEKPAREKLASLETAFERLEDAAQQSSARVERGGLSREQLYEERFFISRAQSQLTRLTNQFGAQAQLGGAVELGGALAAQRANLADALRGQAQQRRLDPIYRGIERAFLGETILPGTPETPGARRSFLQRAAGTLYQARDLEASQSIRETLEQERSREQLNRQRQASFQRIDQIEQARATVAAGPRTLEDREVISRGVRAARGQLDDAATAELTSALRQLDATLRGTAAGGAGGRGPGGLGERFTNAVDTAQRASFRATIVALTAQFGGAPLTQFAQAARGAADLTQPQPEARALLNREREEQLGRLGTQAERASRGLDAFINSLLRQAADRGLGGPIQNAATGLQGIAGAANLAGVGILGGSFLWNFIRGTGTPGIFGGGAAAGAASGAARTVAAAVPSLVPPALAGAALGAPVLGPSSPIAAGAGVAAGAGTTAGAGAIAAGAAPVAAGVGAGAGIAGGIFAAGGAFGEGIGRFVRENIVRNLPGGFGRQLEPFFRPGGALSFQPPSAAADTGDLYGPDAPGPIELDPYIQRRLAQGARYRANPQLQQAEQDYLAEQQINLQDQQQRFAREAQERQEATAFRRFERDQGFERERLTTGYERSVERARASQAVQERSIQRGVAFQVSEINLNAGFQRQDIARDAGYQREDLALQGTRSREQIQTGTQRNIRNAFIGQAFGGGLFGGIIQATLAEQDALEDLDRQQREGGEDISRREQRAVQGVGIQAGRATQAAQRAGDQSIQESRENLKNTLDQSAKDYDEAMKQLVAVQAVARQDALDDARERAVLRQVELTNAEKARDLALAQLQGFEAQKKVFDDWTTLIGNINKTLAKAPENMERAFQEWMQNT